MYYCSYCITVTPMVLTWWYTIDSQYTYTLDGDEIMAFNQNFNGEIEPHSYALLPFNTWYLLYENGQLSLNNQKYGGNPTWRAASLHFWIEISSGSPWYSGTGRSNNECEMYALNQCTILNISFHITHSQSSGKLICMETCHPGSEWPATQRMKHKTSPVRFNALVSRD